MNPKEPFDTPSQAVDQLYRKYAGQLITSLVSFFRLANLSMAEDLVQNTYFTALKDWEQNGIPNDPKAWLFRVCKNKALNELKRKQNFSTHILPKLSVSTISAKFNNAFLDYEIKDNQLRLLFACCHPNFSPKARIILTLKTLAGFKIKEIASGLGMKPEAVKKTLSRTKQQIKNNNMPLRVPFLLQSKERLNSVHQVLYLIFNEAYHASIKEELIRKDLCLQALRMTRSILEETKIAISDTQALFALMLFNVARFEARLDTNGDMIDLKKQDRNLWDQDLIQQGIKFLNQSRKSKRWSRYHYEAAIASLHSTAKHFESTNWIVILKMYDGLFQLSPSPFVRLNRSIALHFSGSSEKALAEIERIDELSSNAIYWTTLGEICKNLDRKEEALNHYLKALKQVANPKEKKAIEKKIINL